jgi:hypothetical protein
MPTIKTVILTAFLVCMALPAVADDALPSIPPEEGSSSMPVDPNQGVTYSVDCYLGNPSEGRNLGSITVTSESEAGPACNSTFGDCNNQCYGCITGGNNVCVDRFGSKFQP